MLPTRLAIAGAIALTLGIVAMGFGLSPSEEASAGTAPGCIAFGANGFTTASPPAETPTCTPTQGIPLATATPDVPEDTPTSPPDDTATSAPPSTEVPATATSPSGGAGAGGLQPPDMGTGTTATPTWLFGAGLVAAIAGAAALLGGMRRRRA